MVWGRISLNGLTTLGWTIPNVDEYVPDVVEA
jgi:hypothetical protein